MSKTNFGDMGQNGWCAYVKDDNSIVIGFRDLPFGGAILYRGVFKGDDTPCMDKIRTNNRALYESIMRYYNNASELGFGDIVYRPCLSYAGKENFVNTQIVEKIIHKDGADYILSRDAIGQSWTDRVESLNIDVFVDKDKAVEKLAEMIAEKERKDAVANGISVHAFVNTYFKNWKVAGESACGATDTGSLKLRNGETAIRIYFKLNKERHWTGKNARVDRVEACDNLGF